MIRSKDFLTNPDTPFAQRLLNALQEARKKIEAFELFRSEPLAIVGMGCRFPGEAINPEGFWQALRQGKDTITPVPRDRWDIDALYDADPDVAGKMCSRYGGFLPEVGLFDASFFGISRKETIGMDPQQRLLLEVSWEALENAGIAPARLRGSLAGVFMGIGTFDYAALRYAQQDHEGIDPYFATGGVLSVAAGRLSYILGLTGPSMAVDTACSSSLVAVHLACQSLRARECDLALAGGVNVILLPELSINFSKARMLSPDGRCKTFDASANGYVRGEGCGVIVLKRMSDALAAGDRILALIRGSAVNQDGPSGGLTVPSGPAQEEVIRRALANAGIGPDQVGYVEAHGTGTSLGDPIEVGSLGKVFGQRSDKDPLVLGSVKTNIGHLEAAAGMAGLIKVVLSLQHGQIPAHLHFRTPNPHIAWDKLPFEIPLQLTPWPEGKQRIAGVSAFGASGTNAHIIVEQGPAGATRVEPARRALHLLALSARDEVALKELAGRYAAHIAEHGQEALADVCYTANTGRSHFDERLALIGGTHEQIAAGCRAYRQGRAVEQIILRKTQSGQKIAFLFSDQGSRFVGMGRDLYETAPVFRAVMQRCAESLKGVLQRPLLDVLYTDAPGKALDDSAYAQPALFAVQVALFELWKSWGIAPSLVMGHGVGEVAAACAAGVFCLEQGLQLIAARGRLDRIGADGQGVKQTVAELTWASPCLGIVSALSGDLATEAMAQPDYWVRQAREQANLQAGLRTLKQQGCAIFVELGPDSELLTLGRTCLPDGYGVWLPSLRQGHADWQPLLQSLGQLYAQGVTVDWQGFDRDYARNKVVLPTYPFQRQRYWIQEAKAPKPAPSNTADQPVHPLLGQRLATAHRDVIFTTRISKDEPAFLKDHRIYDALVFPATGYVEMALAAGSQLLGSDALTIEEFSIHQALIVPEDQSCALQTILHPEKDGGYLFEIFSALTDSQWHLHATGKIHGSGPQELSAQPLEALKALCTQPVSVAEHYRGFAEKGIVYGPCFQGIEQLMHGQGQSLGFLRASGPVAAQLSDYKLHPGLFDAGLQTAASILPAGSGQDNLLPVGLRRLRISQGCPPLLWSHARLRQDSALNQNHTLDFCLYDPTGRTVVEVQGFAVKRATRQTLLENVTPKSRAELYTVSWPAAPLPEQVGKSDLGRWLIFADARGLGEKTAQALNAAGAQTALVYRGQGYRDEGAGRYRVNPLAAKDFEQLLAGRPCQGLIHLWILDSGARTDLVSIEQGQILGCASVLHLVQALGRAAFAPRIWLVTRGAQATGDVTQPVAAHQCALWGFARVIALEHPQLQSVCIDLDPQATDDEDQLLLAELAAPDGQDRIAYRKGMRYGARLIRAEQRPAQEKECRRITLQAYGIIENLTLVPMQPSPPDKGQVQIAVRATGLNFRDVLRALGMLKAYEPHLQHAPDARFGFECSGTITALGQGVQGFKIGDEVIAGLTVQGSLGSYVTVDANAVVPKPVGMSHAEGATIPLAFLTAYYGLEHLAKLQKGERVLIHAAAGGVGLAAIQIAQRAGAVIYATASPGKWEYLKSLGVQAVMNSRTLEYANQIMRMTDGQGVQVILNSLTGEYIPENLKILTQGGRFIEIGKIGIWDKDKVRRQRPDVGYYPFDLGQVAQKDAGLLHRMFTELMAGFERAELTPLKRTEFGLPEAAKAFRYMAQAKHIGKVVLTADAQAVRIRSDASYLITGGLGALGYLLAEQLKHKGAGNIVLCARNAEGPGMADKIERLRGNGTNVIVMPGDVSCPADVDRILEKIRTTLPELKGIIHAAGILDDGILQDQTWERFAGVMAPKITGAWNLHRHLSDLQLDFFILFSSTASGLGSPGQSNYAAANAFLDGFGHELRRTGCRATTINWGPWDGLGMAASHKDAGARYERQGVRPMSSTDGLRLFDRILTSDLAQVYAIDIEWNAYLRHLGTQLPKNKMAGFLTQLLNDSAKADDKSGKATAFKRKLTAAAGRQGITLMRSTVIDAACKVMGHDQVGRIKLDQPLMEQGLDSLMSVELRNLLAESLDISLPVGLLFDYPSIDDLCLYLSQLLQMTGAEIAPENSSDPAGTNTEDEFAYIDEMDAADLEALIRKEIN